MFLASATPSDNLTILVTLSIMWFSAKLMAEVFERLKQPFESPGVRNIGKQTASTNQRRKKKKQ